MNQYRPTFGIEPTDKYEKAKQDIIKACKSFNELSFIQQETLAKQLFGAANVAAVLNIIQRDIKNR